MNSDPYDSAAWRTLGMLDSDESAIFDEAMRHDPLLRAACHEMNRLGAAVAASMVAPIPVRPGQLERLQIRLGLLTPAKRSPLWLGLSGWAAAAVLALLLVFQHGGSAKKSKPVAATASTGQTQPTRPNATAAAPQTETAATPAEPGTATDAAATGDASTAASAASGKPAAKTETKRLVQEIEVLRENLEQFQQRDRQLFDILPGRALPLVMTMLPPGENPEDLLAQTNDDARSPLTAMLGDALANIARDANADEAGQLAEDGTPLGPSAVANPLPAALADGQPAAIPIYDAARDAGTLVVSNLPVLEQDQAYHLWVTTSAADRPIYVGSLPESSTSGSDTFDFSLGSQMVLPSGFMLTKDPAGAPATPGGTNTVLQGPPVRKP